MRESKSARNFFPPGRYWRVNLNQLKYWIHWTCLGDSFLGALRASRFLWSIHTSRGTLLPSKNCLQVSRTHWTTKAFFSQLPKCKGWSFPHTFFWSRMVPTVTSLALVYFMKGSSGFGCLRVGSTAKSRLSFSNAAWHYRVQLSDWLGLGFTPVLSILVAWWWVQLLVLWRVISGGSGQFISNLISIGNMQQLM